MTGHRTLLNRGFPESEWGNLGLWTKAKTYPEACEALAARLAEHAELQPGSRLLDVGFGHGDQLLLWKRRFDVGPITGIEADAEGLAVARKRTASFPDVTLNLDDHPWEGGYDHVFALDCAYHFAPRRHFFLRARQALSAGGILALTDLVMTTKPGLVSRLLARACDIPPENLLTETDYARQLEETGFEAVRIERLDDVLSGFARFAQSISPWSAGGMRIRVSALAARWLGGKISYVVVAARAAIVSR